MNTDIHVNSQTTWKAPFLRSLVPPSVRLLCWRGPLKPSRCSLYHSYDPHLRRWCSPFLSPSLPNSSSFRETNRLEVTPGTGDDDSWLRRSTQSEEFSFTFKTPWCSIGCNRTQFPPGLGHKSPLKALRGLLNWNVQIKFGFGSVAMKMFPLGLTFSTCRNCFILKGIQIEQIRLLTIPSGPVMDQTDWTKTDNQQCFQFEYGSFVILLDPNLARGLVKLSLALKQATVAGKKISFHSKKPWSGPGIA